MNDRQEARLVDAEYRRHLETVTERHDTALEACGYDAVVIHAGCLHPLFLDDQSYPFRVNPHFAHWVPGLSDPESVLVYRPGAKPCLLHYRPADFWHKVPDAPSGHWVEHFEIKALSDWRDIRAHLGGDLANTVFVGEAELRARDWGIETCNPQAFLHRLHYARSLKTDYELGCMRLANRRAVRGHWAAESAFRERGCALDIHLAYLKAVRHAEHELPYGSIVALNENCAVLHYQFIEKSPPSDGQWRSFLIDAGASHRGYAADITRTYAADSADFQALVDAVDGAQRELCGGIGPGIDFREMQSKAHRQVARILAETGIVKLQPDTVFELGLTRSFFPHGLGHFLGLQVHDVGGLLSDPEGGSRLPPEDEPYLRLTRHLEPGQVLTIEPGVYFIGVLLEQLRASRAARHVDWTAVNRLAAFGGVRIEDNVAVSEVGHENFTRDAFAERPQSG